MGKQAQTVTLAVRKGFDNGVTFYYVQYHLKSCQPLESFMSKFRMPLIIIFILLLIIAWTLMKKKEPFNPDYLKIA
jgi:hypothetical protein